MVQSPCETMLSLYECVHANTVEKPESSQQVAATAGILRVDRSGVEAE